jgi:hypothetical protein
VGWRNRDNDLVERGVSQARTAWIQEAPTGTPRERSQECPRVSGELSSRAAAAAGDPLWEPINAQLERVTTEIHGLQHQLDALIARRNQTVADRASHHVAAIVAAAERSAAAIRAAAEKDAASIRERLLADVQANVERIRSEAQSDAARIRREAHARAAQARQRAINEVSTEVEAVCARLSAELQARGRAAIAAIAGSSRMTAPRATVQHAIAKPSPRAAADAPIPTRRITDEMQGAVQELQNATSALEQSLRNRRVAGD